MNLFKKKDQKLTIIISYIFFYSFYNKGKLKKKTKKLTKIQKLLINFFHLLIINFKKKLINLQTS